MIKVKSLLPLAVFAAVSTQLPAATTNFFGEDLNFAGDPTTATPTQSSAARDQFFSNLNGVGTESFEGFATGTTVPLSVNFPGAGTATLSGDGTIVSGNDGGGRFPISGTQFLETSAGAGFNLAFSSPIAAFGFFGTDIGDFGGQAILTLTDINGATSTITVPNTSGDNGSTTGSALYFGFYDKTNSYTNIAFQDTSTQDVFGFDDFSIGSNAQVVPVAPAPPVTSATPEPATYSLFGAGLLAAAAFKRWTRRSN